MCEILQVVPGKVEDFLGVLYEFESNPEGRTAVDLFGRLKPVLSDWPELLRDFAAFLHPEQAQECGLVRGNKHCFVFVIRDMSVVVLMPCKRVDSLTLLYPCM